jgi:ferredoxin
LKTSPPTSERYNSLRKLIALMNTRHELSFPVTEPLLKCFDLALNPEETDFLIRLGTEPYTYEKAASLSTLNEDQFRAFFRDLLRKGFIWPHEANDDQELFTLPGIMLGWFEVFLSTGEETDLKREFSRQLDALLKSFGEMKAVPRKFLNYRVRFSQPHQSILAPGEVSGRGKGQTIAVNAAVDADPAKVVPSRYVEELIGKHGDESSIALVHCFCRQYHKMVDEPCKFEHPAQSCIAIGHLGRFAIRHGMAKQLSKTEALNLVRTLQSKGAVHQVFHKDEDIHNPEIAICNCCWDCCGVLGSYNRGLIPLNLLSFFEAQLSDSSLCNGCGTCEEFCPVHAISIVEDICRIDGMKCIGCGQCELQCPEDAIRLLENERRVFLPVQKKSDARIQT